MVKKIERKSGGAFVCEECGFAAYADEKIAEACQAWCSEHHSCNI